MNRNLKSLSVDEFENEIKNKALVLDTRNPEEFENGFVKGAINIGLNGRFAEWVGTLININQPLLIVAEEGKEEESILRLARVGYENVKGYLKGGYNSWMTAGKSLDMVLTIDAEEFELDMKHEKILWWLMFEKNRNTMRAILKTLRIVCYKTLILLFLI